MNEKLAQEIHDFTYRLILKKCPDEDDVFIEERDWENDLKTCAQHFYNRAMEDVKKEIEQRLEKHYTNLPDADSPEDDWTHNELCELGAYKELEHFEDFIDNLTRSVKNT